MKTSIHCRTVTLLALTVCAMALGLLFTTPPADAQQNTAGTNPCPRFSIQNVFDDPNGDWDYDRVPNAVELNNGLKPCVSTDGEKFCTQTPLLCIKYTTAFTCNGKISWTWNAVNKNPNGDWDRDGITNIIEARNGANPCAHPCPYPTKIDVLLNPNGSWDNDGMSNALEVELGRNPCNGVIYRPCPNWTAADIAAHPNGDWDRDGVSNRNEAYYNTNPCKAPTVYVAPTVIPQQPTPQVHQLPPGYRCPTGYPYFNSATGLCQTYRPATLRPQPVVDQPPAGYHCPAGYPYYNAATGKCNTRPIVRR